MIGGRFRDQEGLKCSSRRLAAIVPKGEFIEVEEVGVAEVTTPLPERQGLKQQGLALEGVVHALRLRMPRHGHALSLDRNRNDVLVPTAISSLRRDTAGIPDWCISGLP